MKETKTKQKTSVKKLEALKNESGVLKKYIEAIGRRKEATARVRLQEDKPQIFINNKNLAEYFPLLNLQQKVLEPFSKTNIENKYLISVKVKGGGLTGQAEAIRLGISRALVKIDNNLKPILKKFNLLTRDSRVVERKKYGFKKARKRPQWAKR